MKVMRSLEGKKMETKEKMNGKMLELTIENKELKKRMGEWIVLQHECQELKKKKEAWNEAKHAY